MGEGEGMKEKIRNGWKKQECNGAQQRNSSKQVTQSGRQQAFGQMDRQMQGSKSRLFKID